MRQRRLCFGVSRDPVDEVVDTFDPAVIYGLGGPRYAASDPSQVAHLG
jgi:hypothetical protein